jgi:putative transposase
VVGERPAASAATTGGAATAVERQRRRRRRRAGFGMDRSSFGDFRGEVGARTGREVPILARRHCPGKRAAFLLVIIPKYRGKALLKELRRHLGEVFRELARQQETPIEEGHLLPDHAHMLISTSPKYSVAQVVGYIMGKGGIHIARVYAGRRRNLKGQHFWARSYFVSTVGRDEASIRRYIQQQEAEDRRHEQLQLV